MSEIKAINLEQQQDHLQKVSRTFALTIPLLPKDLADYVGNAYLLCRIADTIEDDPKALPTKKIIWLKDFAFFASKSFAKEEDLLSLKERALALTKDGAKDVEYALIEDMDKVIKRTLTFPSSQLQILAKGVSILASGMADKLAEIKINNEDDVDSYCYLVAGVVGELLAALFAQVDNKIIKDEFMPLAVSFGEGLQLTNILKDRFDDSKRGASFLPKVDEDKLKEEINYYIEKTLGHLDDALRFVLKIPTREKGIRLFCYFNVAMAIVTLRKIAKNPLGISDSLKISRTSVKSLALLCTGAVKSDCLLQALHHMLSFNLKRQAIDVKSLYRKVSKWQDF